MEVFEISILIRLIIGALATFFAILLWSKTTNIAWVFIVIGTIVSYTEIVFSTLINYGIINNNTLFGVPEFPIVQSLLLNLPMIFYIIAFIIAILRTKHL